MVKKRLLITGISGMLGKALLYENRNNYEIFGLYYKNRMKINNIKTYQLDITRLDLVYDFFLCNKPDIVIHTAALTDVDLCEVDKKTAFLINVKGTENIKELVQKYNTKLIFISTDYVFDGEKGFYNENDCPNPVNYYGYTKLKAEEILLDYKFTTIIRTTFYGLNPFGEKSGIENIIKKIKLGESIKASYNTFNSIISINNISKIIYKIIELELNGIYHIGTSGSISRYDFLLYLANIFNLDSHFIIKVDHDEYYKNKIAKRPKNVSLNNSKLLSALEIKEILIEDDIMNFKSICFDYYKFFGGNFEC